jgi:hypothetical protein
MFLKMIMGENMAKACICIVMKKNKRVVLAIFRRLRILYATFLVVNISPLYTIYESASLVDHKTTF